MITAAYQPPTKIITADGITTVLQLTDLHLFEDAQQSSQAASCEQHFEAVLAQALAEEVRCDLILVTGDLVHEVKPSTYERIYRRLERTGIPFACIAGNHDVTDELIPATVLDSETAFEQRTLVARSLDSRLLEQHVIETTNWQLLLMDSSLPGQVAGKISADSLAWLQAQLSRCSKPALLALHHHILPMQSAWIDAHIAKNAASLWELLASFPQLKVIIHGHTHQQQLERYQGVTIYTTPATSYQFLPGSDEFAFDNQALPGYRWIQLAPDSQFNSWVVRLQQH